MIAAESAILQRRSPSPVKLQPCDNSKPLIEVFLDSQPHGGDDSSDEVAADESETTGPQRNTVTSTAVSVLPNAATMKSRGKGKANYDQDDPVFDIRKVFEKNHPRIKLSDEAADVLNDVLMEHFALITSKAVKEIKKDKNAVFTHADVKRIVAQVSSKCAL